MCDHFKDCVKRFDKIDNALNALNTRLFKGNGKDPWDVRLDRLERFRSGSVWFYGILIIAGAGLIGRLVYVLIIS